MKPQPWSHSRLSAFETCPRQFYEVQVAKNVKDVKGEATIWGEVVHERFEERLRDGTPLPTDLEMHEPYLKQLTQLSGTKLVEAKIALNKELKPCGFFDQDVWYRGVIDYGRIHGDFAHLVDHKTGKHHAKFGQLKLFAIHTFIAYPQVDTVRCEYYWTQTLTTNGQSFKREQLPDLWREFTGPLKQYAEAYRTDTWQPRQSGLCGGWCPVTTCEFWRPKKRK